MVRFTAFDLETGIPHSMTVEEYLTRQDIRAAEDPKQWHDPFDDWPFPITIAAWKTWYKQWADTYYEPSTHGIGTGVHTVLNELNALHQTGHMLVGWNSTRFDWRALAQASGCYDLCRRLCLTSFDPALQVLWTEGYMIGQNATCKGLGFPGKPQNDMGAQAPVLWAAGQYKQVVDYCKSDVNQLAAIFHYGNKYNYIKWQTQKGGMSAYPLPWGWLRVEQILQLPEPNQSWLDNPIPPKAGLEWLIG